MLDMVLLMFLAADSKEKRIRDGFDDLTARTVAVLESARNIEGRVRAQGHVLHPDIVSARARLELFMDDTEAAIRDKQWDEAGKLVKQTRACLERLERAVR